MDEIERARRALRGVDGELDGDRVLARVRALQRDEPVSTVLIPLTREAATRPLRPRPTRAVALLTACLAAVTALVIGVASPWRDDAGPIQPGAPATVTNTPSPSASPPVVDERELLRTIAAATVDTCYEARLEADDKEYLVQLDDGSWSFAQETTTDSLRTAAAKVDELVLTRFARLLTGPDDYRTTSRETANGSLRVEVALAADAGLTELALLVDPASLRVTAVTGRTRAGDETTIAITCHPSSLSRSE